MQDLLIYLEIMATYVLKVIIVLKVLSLQKLVQRVVLAQAQDFHKLHNANNVLQVLMEMILVLHRASHVAALHVLRVAPRAASVPP